LKEVFKQIQEDQRWLCKVHSDCEFCSAKSTCLLIGSSPVSIFNAGYTYIMNRIEHIKKGYDFYTEEKLKDPYFVGLFNGIEQTISFLEGRRSIVKSTQLFSFKQRIKILFTGKL